MLANKRWGLMDEVETAVFPSLLSGVYQRADHWA
jgi:hypothetical protein